jgi:creatinine amidohydrolase
VLGEGHGHGQASAVDPEATGHSVEDEPEDGAVRGVPGKPGEAPVRSARQRLPQHGHIGVIAAEHALVEGLEDAPDSRSRGSGRRRSPIHLHKASLPAVEIRNLGWMDVERYLERDDRIVLPLGSTEQHAYLSLATDSILAERVSVEAAEPVGVLVLPALAYGVTPHFAAYPGSPSIGQDTYVQVLRDLLSSLQAQGFRRILVVNGHGGNSFAAEHVAGAGVRWHDWWIGPRVRAVVERIDHDGSHASWMENFPWTRLSGVELPAEHKPPVDLSTTTDPVEVRRLAGDGPFGGWYERSDGEVLELWQAGVEEVRSLLAFGAG